MGKYNKPAESTTLGAGLNAILNPFSLGLSVYDDVAQIRYTSFQAENIRHRIQTANMGLHLSSLILGYSQLNLVTTDRTYEAKVNLYTASLLLKNFITTIAKRVEDSPAPGFNYSTYDLENKQIKEDYFGGFQLILSKHVTVEILYNYYLLREYAATITIFF